MPSAQELRVGVQVAVLCFLCGCTDRAEALLGCAIGVADARLPAAERRFVAEVEEEHTGNFRLAGGELERTSVGGALLLLGRGRRDLAGAVERPPGWRDRGFDADLAVEDRKTASSCAVPSKAVASSLTSLS